MKIRQAKKILRNVDRFWSGYNAVFCNQHVSNQMYERRSIRYFKKNDIDMRKISFRGKEIKTGKWVYGDLIHGVGNKEGRMYILPRVTIYPPGCHSLDGWEVDPETVGQFTGFLDKNKKEIYEGDIIQLTNESGDVILVTCEFGHAHREFNGVLCDIVGFYFTLPNGKKSFPICSNYLGKHDTELFEVVGNIHDNPEIIIKTI